MTCSMKPMIKRFTVDRATTVSNASGVFRDLRSGAWATRVMSASTYDKACGRANTALEQAISHPPALPGR
jgi:hypothetical protein